MFEPNISFFWRREGKYILTRYHSVVSLALGRPFAIQDSDITVEVRKMCFRLQNVLINSDLQAFADADDENIKPDGILQSDTLEPSTMAVPLHILSLRRIASDIGTLVHSAKFNQPHNKDERDKNIQELHRRLVEWRRSMPFPLPDLQLKVPHLCTSWFDLNYYLHIIMLYRPSSAHPNMDPSGMKTLANASCMAIRQAMNMHRQHRFSYNWLNLVAVFNSALSLMYTSTTKANTLSFEIDHSLAVADLDLAMELLESFSEKFPSARKIQSMIRSVITKLTTSSPSSSFD